MPPEGEVVVVMACLRVLLSRSGRLTIKVVALCLFLCGARGETKGLCKMGVGLGLFVPFFFLDYAWIVHMGNK